MNVIELLKNKEREGVSASKEGYLDLALSIAKGDKAVEKVSDRKLRGIIEQAGCTVGSLEQDVALAKAMIEALPVTRDAGKHEALERVARAKADAVHWAQTEKSDYRARVTLMRSKCTREVNDAKESGNPERIERAAKRLKHWQEVEEPKLLAAIGSRSSHLSDRVNEAVSEHKKYITAKCAIDNMRQHNPELAKRIIKDQEAA